MDDILQDYHGWRVLCYERFSLKRYDFFSQRNITVGYRLFHKHDGAMIYVSEYAWWDMEKLLEPYYFQNLDYYKIIYKLKIACYFEGKSELNVTGVTKDWVKILFDSSRFKEWYKQFAPADMDFNYTRKLFDDYVQKRIVLGEPQKQYIADFLEKVMCPIFLYEERDICRYYKEAFLLRG